MGGGHDHRIARDPCHPHGHRRIRLSGLSAPADPQITGRIGCLHGRRVWSGAARSSGAQKICRHSLRSKFGPGSIFRLPGRRAAGHPGGRGPIGDGYSPPRPGGHRGKVSRSPAWHPAADPAQKSSTFPGSATSGRRSGQIRIFRYRLILSHRRSQQRIPLPDVRRAGGPIRSFVRQDRQDSRLEVFPRDTSLAAMILHM
jgi:hypothetical protein